MEEQGREGKDAKTEGDSRLREKTVDIAHREKANTSLSQHVCVYQNRKSKAKKNPKIVSAALIILKLSIVMDRLLS